MRQSPALVVVGSASTGNRREQNDDPVILRCTVVAIREGGVPEEPSTGARGETTAVRRVTSLMDLFWGRTRQCKR